MKFLKKLLALLSAAVIPCITVPAATASAAAVGTAYTIEYDGISLDIDIIDDFSSYSGTELYGDFQYTFGDGKLTLEIPSGGYGWDGPTEQMSPSLNLDGIEQAYNNATYFGCRVKNTGTATAVLAFEDRVPEPLDFAMQAWVLTGIKMVSSNGIKDAAGTSVTYRGYGINIPGGFDGWLFIPFSATKIKQESFNKGEDLPNYLAKFECPRFCGTAKGSGKAVLEIDDFFLSSANLTGAEPGSTPKPSANPTASPEDGMTFARKYTYRVQKDFDRTPNTFEAWIKMPSYLTNGAIISSYGNGMYPAIALEVKNKQPNLLWGDPNYVQNYTFSKVNVCTGKWLHLAVVRDFEAKEVRCYLNGRLAQTLPLQETDRELRCSAFLVGSDLHANNSQAFLGNMRSLAVYDSARTAEQIKADMDAPEKCGAMIASYEFSDADAETIADLSGNGYDVVRSEYANFTYYIEDSYYFEEDQIPALEDYDYTFALIGDTQIVTEYYPDDFHKIYDWILANKDAQNIQYVMGLGDITNHSTDAEWELAMKNILRMKGVVPFSLVIGNPGHDNVEPFNRYYPYETYKDTVDGTYNNSMINSWKKFTVGKRQFIVFTLEFGPSRDVLDWAGEIIDANPDCNVIITTHSFLFRDGNYHDKNGGYAPSTCGGVLNGDEMWEYFVRKHQNIVLVLCGHTSSDNIVIRQDTGDNGNIVTSMLINPQDADTTFKALGMVATLHISDHSDTVQVRYYSTVKQKYFTMDSQFRLAVDFVDTVPEPTEEPTESPTSDPTAAPTDGPATEPTAPGTNPGASGSFPIVPVVCGAAVVVLALGFAAFRLIKAGKKKA